MKVMTIVRAGPKAGTTRLINAYRLLAETEGLTFWAMEEKAMADDGEGNGYASAYLATENLYRAAEQAAENSDQEYENIMVAGKFSTFASMVSFIRLARRNDYFIQIIDLRTNFPCASSWEAQAQLDADKRVLVDMHGIQKFLLNPQRATVAEGQ